MLFFDRLPSQSQGQGRLTGRVCLQAMRASPKDRGVFGGPASSFRGELRTPGFPITLPPCQGRFARDSEPVFNGFSQAFQVLIQPCRSTHLQDTSYVYLLVYFIVSGRWNHFQSLRENNHHTFACCVVKLLLLSETSLASVMS